MDANALEPVQAWEDALIGCNRILLAEDDGELRSLLAFALESDGYDVVQVEDGVRLQGYLSSQAPIDAVIADVRMPGRTGVEALSLLRELDWATPFVLMTAFGSDEFHEQARALGVTAVFDKPFDLDELRAVVRRVVPLAKSDSDGPPTPNVAHGGRPKRRKLQDREVSSNRRIS